MPEDESVLIDTSAWIEGFRGKSHPELHNFMKSCLDAGVVATSPVIVLELIQGCRTEKEKQDLQEDLESLDLLDISSKTWEISYNLGFQLRRKGVTVPTVDVIVAAQAIEHNCLLFHHDSHFEIIARNAALMTRTFLQKRD